MFIQNFKFLRSINGAKSMARMIHRCPMKSKKGQKIIINRIKSNEFYKAVQLMNSYFFDDPLTTALHVKKDAEACRVLASIWLSAMETGYSLKSLCPPRKRMTGVCVNCDFDREDSYEESMSFAKLVKSEPLRNLLLAWAKIYTDPKMETVEGGKGGKGVLEIAGVAVHRKYRGLRIAERLMVGSVQLARNLGYNYIRVDCTSPYSAKICEKNNFHVIWEKPLCEFPGTDSTLCGQLAVKVYLKDLKDSSVN